MKFRTCNSSIKLHNWLLLGMVLCSTLQLWGQQVQVPRKVSRTQQPQKVATRVDTIPWLTACYIGADLYAPGAHLLGSDYLGSEVSLSVSLKNRFIPIVECGMGRFDAWSDTGIRYKSKLSPYIRLGVDYNTMAKKKNKDSFLYAGLRYGMSRFHYEVASLPLTDPVWGDKLASPGLEDAVWKGNAVYTPQPMKGSLQWLELVLGVNVKLYKHLHMGWSFRMKYKLSDAIHQQGLPEYIPGYGKYQSNTMGLTYSLIYKIPFRR